MIIQESIDKIISYGFLTVEEKEDISLFFEHYGSDKIIEVDKNTYYTYKSYITENKPVDIHVTYNQDMFLASINIIVKYGYAVADDLNGNHVCVLSYMGSTYNHRYVYSGGADLSFINQYDCIFLYDCNEFSVELCQSALKLWSGKRLVLVGENWEGLIPMLPELQAECWHEPLLTDERFNELSYGMKSLRVIFGMPHAEPMDRYNEGIMYYDEIMSFIFMFADYRQLGELNSDKNFLVIDGYYDNLGLFVIQSKVETVARYAKSKGFIPVINLKMAGTSFYQNNSDDDIWSKFYEQPEGYTLDEVYKSKNVYFVTPFYNGSVQSTLMERMAGNTQLSWVNGVYNTRVKKYIQERLEKYLPAPSKTLGVLARGTDYVNTHLHNHPIHASKEMLCEKINEMFNNDKTLEYIYIATEDAGYCEYFKGIYKDKVSFTDQERFQTKENELLADYHRNEKIKRDGFFLGAEYIASIYLLAHCKSLLASGGCGGLDEARKENGGKYKDVYVFNLGVNE